jgi:dihydroflavonol-4-reductase
MSANQTLYVVTGADGFLGSAVVRHLSERGSRVRALVLDRPGLALSGLRCEIRSGDICSCADLPAMLRGDPGQRVVVIHTAGIVSVASQVRPEVYRTNVEGTQRILDACRSAGVTRLVYVSSVHAIPVLPRGRTMVEVDEFSADQVEGEYAKTKAEATRRVLAATDLDVVVVHPSGLVGPGDRQGGLVTTLLRKVGRGELLASVSGGYDFVDVRDVAVGIVVAADKGKRGRCYLLTGGYHRATDIIRAVAARSGRRWRRPQLPVCFARIAAPFVERLAAWRHETPEFTAYSLKTLSANAAFSHARATRELGYRTRPWDQTLGDTEDVNFFGSVVDGVC